jgi:hypothetical protein
MTYFGIWWVSASMMKYQQGDNQDNLIPQLTPTLHKESLDLFSSSHLSVNSDDTHACDFSSTV